METLIYKAVPKTKKAIPAYLVSLAERLTPSFQRDDIRYALQSLDCKSRRDYAWASAEVVAGVIKRQIEASFDIWLLMGEASFLYVSICFPLAHTPFLQLAALMVLMLPLLRLRDAYLYPAEGSIPEMLLDAVLTVGCVAVFQGAALAVAPRLALPMLNVYFAAAGALMVAAWRMMFHRQDPADPRHRKLKGRCLAIWQVNVLWFAATFPLLLSSMDAVPGSGRRDSVLGALPVYLMAAATRLRKAHYTSIWERPLLGLKNPDLKELTYARAKVWFCDRVSSFRADLIAEVAYFGVMSYLLFVAAWRWVSNDPSAATVDWLQVAVNLVALVLLILLWVRIKKMNEQLAREIEQEIRLRQFERGQG